MEKQKAKTGPKKKVGKKQRRKRKLILFIVEVLVILILLVVFYVMSKLNKINNTGSLDAKKLNINIDSETQEVLDNYTNIAIFGIDNRSSGNYESGNSDCIMIASINDDTKEVTVDGEPVKLTPIEYNILFLLVKNQGKVFSIDQIYENIWNEEAIGADNTVAVHIRHIREKIEINPKEPRYLKVVWGVGYKVEKQ